MEPLFGNQSIQDAVNLFVALIRVIGVAGIGVCIGWLALDLLNKTQAWQLQIAVFLGVVSLTIALVHFLYWNAAATLGMYGIGLCIALFVWGLPKKKKKDEK